MFNKKPAKVRMAPPATRIYAIGDIHGSLELLKKINRMIINYEVKMGRPERSVIIYLGDYVDRGPKSKEVLEYLVNNKAKGFEQIFLKGNHEYALLEFIKRPDFLKTWVNWGGDATLKSYGITVKEKDLKEPGKTKDAFVKLIPQSHIDFLKQLKKYHTEGDYIFVHAGLKPGLDLKEQDEMVMLMIRNDFYESDYDFGKNVVFGHTIFEKPFVQNGRIGVDTGAFLSGHLTAAVIEKDKLEFIAT